MKKLLKVVLSPLIGFAAYFIAIRYSTKYFTLKIDEMGEGTIESFMAFYRYFLPLLFTVAVLTQLLIIIPIWDRVFLKSRSGKVTSLLILCFICIVFATSISYIIWDPHSGIMHLIRQCVFMIAVQLFYWAVNLLILYLLDNKPKELSEVSDSAIK